MTLGVLFCVTGIQSVWRLQGRVVDVADSALRVKRFWMRFIEWCINFQACRQVWVGDKRYAEGYSVSLAGSQPGIGAFLGEAFVGDVRAAKGFLELWAEAVCGHMLAGTDIGDATLAQLAGYITKGFSQW